MGDPRSAAAYSRAFDFAEAMSGNLRTASFKAEGSGIRATAAPMPTLRWPRGLEEVCVWHARVGPPAL